jgi:proteasome lid subunit RPN8/RPN11
MVFEEIKYREPHRLRRPDRDRRFACVAYELPQAGDLPIFLERATADAIERHALRDVSVELGGILLGKECVDDVTGEPFVLVTKSLEAKHYENTQASFTYTHDSWEEITRERDRLHADLDIVGWYHTHPDFGIFLSSHDLFIHHNFFSEPLQVAYVVDPIRQTRGFFRWRNGQMDQVGGFQLVADRDDRLALVRLVNDLENITPSPSSDSGGGGIGGLSPRLEAELIAMLSRPVTHHQAVSSPADRAQLAVLYGLIGAVVGTVGLGAVLWLNQLQSNLQEQAKLITQLEATVKDSTDRQRFVLDTVVDSAGGKSAETLVEQYAKASRERAEAQRKLADKEALLNMAGASKSAQDKQIAELTKERDRYKTDAKTVEDAQRLRERVEDLAEENKTLTQKVIDLGGDTAEGKAKLGTAEKYAYTWYAAIAGWTVSVLLALGLAANYAMSGRPPMEEEAYSPPQPPENPPPHRIT